MLASRSLVALIAVGFVRSASAQPAVPETAPPAVPVVSPISPASSVATPPAEDFDLGSVGLDPHEAVDDKLNIYGFADFTYSAVHLRKPTMFVGDSHSFGVGNLNIYISKNLTRKWRTLSEIRFLFTPNGSLNPDGSITNTTASDPANIHRSIEWGGIRIERAYLEYDVHPKLTIRAGHWLSPYGVWNIDHGSPAIIPALRPYVIGEQFIPEHQTGIEAFGATYFGEYKVAYHATVSNGRHPAEATQDPDGKLALGARLALTAPLLNGTLDFGVSAYRGRATEMATSIVGPAPVSFDEVALATDVVWKRDKFLAQAEIMGRDVDYRTGRRPRIGEGFQPNGRDVGGYALTGYRFDRAWNVMPFALLQYYRPVRAVVFRRMQSASVGLNFRPAPAIVLKAMATVGDTEGAGQFGDLGRITYVTGQAAWVF